jgi:hypothetical protein
VQLVLFTQHFHQVVRNVTLVQVKINGTEYFRKTISATGPLDLSVLYLGGMPQVGRTIRQADTIQELSEITKEPVNFKGIIQDVLVNRLFTPWHVYSKVFHVGRYSLLVCDPLSLGE